MADLTPQEIAQLDQKRAEVAEVVDLLITTSLASMETDDFEFARRWARDVLDPLMELDPHELRLVVVEMVRRLTLVEIRLQRLYGRG